MKKAIFYFLKNSVISRLGWFLSVSHLCFVVFDFAQKKPVEVGCREDLNIAGANLIAGRIFHFSHETILLEIIILLDTPGILLSAVIALFLIPLDYILPDQCFCTLSWIGAMVLLTTTSVQWCFIGYMIERIVRSTNGSKI